MPASLEIITAPTPPPNPQPPQKKELKSGEI